MNLIKYIGTTETLQVYTVYLYRDTLFLESLKSVSSFKKIKYINHM